MSRIIFVNRFYWPEEPATGQLLADLAERLAQRGHLVTVITSQPAQAHHPSREVYRGVSIRRVGCSRWGKSSLIGRLADFGSFILGATGHLCHYPRRGDLVVYLTDPPLLAAVTWPLLAMRGVSFVHWVQDIYPEIAMELTGHRWTRIARPGRNLAWRRARCCVTLGTDMARVIANAGVPNHRTRIIPNWAPAGTEAPSACESTPIRNDWGLTGKFVVLYSGNLGRVHDLEPIIEAAALLRGDEQIAFVFVGQGAQRETLAGMVVERALANVHFHPPQPRAKLAATLAMGDVHFVTLREGCESYVFPSKLYGVAAVGRPIVFIGPAHCELAHLVADRAMGTSVTRHDIVALARTISDLSKSPGQCDRQGKAALAFAESQSIDYAVDAWDELLLSERNLAESAHPAHR